MEPSRRALLEHLAQVAEEGAFGDSIRASLAEYAALPHGLPVFLKLIDEFCSQNEQLDPETRRFRSLLCQLLIAAYRDAFRVSSELSEPFLFSLIRDFPGADESALLTRWSALAESSLNLRELSSAGSRSLVWQQMERVFVAYNEFLDGLLGFILVLLRASAGKQVRPGVFQCAYGDKVRQISDLTGGDDGAYYLLTRIARPQVRNASAHGRLWIDPAQGVVRYVDGRSTKTERSMPIGEFAALTHLGSHLVMSYLAAVGTLVTLTVGGTEVRGLLPATLVDLWDFFPDPSD